MISMRVSGAGSRLRIETERRRPQAFRSCFDDAFGRTYPNAGGLVGKAFAFGAGRGVDDKDVVSGAYCVYRAFGFAGCTERALFGDLQ